MAIFLPDIRTIILAQFPAETVALYAEPPDPPYETVTLYGPGGPDGVKRLDGTTVDDRHVQVRVRDSSAHGRETRTEALFDYFQGIHRFAAYYMVLKNVGGVLYSYPRDANGNYIASFNLLKMNG